MAVDANAPIGIINAGADLSAKQGFFVSLNSSGLWDVATADVQPGGVLLNDPKSGQAALVETRRGVIVPIEVGASQTIAPGDKIAVVTGGQGKESASTNIVAAIALEAATTAGGEKATISCLFFGNFLVTP